jgi:hypothetical protein
LVADKSFFGADSSNIRVGGVEEKERVAKSFVSLLVELNPEKSLTVKDSYAAFREYCGKNGLMLVKRTLLLRSLARLGLADQRQL